MHLPGLGHAKYTASSWLSRDTPPGSLASVLWGSPRPSMLGFWLRPQLSCQPTASISFTVCMNMQEWTAGESSSYRQLFLLRPQLTVEQDKPSSRCPVWITNPQSPWPNKWWGFYTTELCGNLIHSYSHLNRVYKEESNPAWQLGKVFPKKVKLKPNMQNGS